VSLTALTSAEISLPAEADGARVSDRIAVLADTVDVVGLTDNHAGQAYAEYPRVSLQEHLPHCLRPTTTPLLLSRELVRVRQKLLESLDRLSAMGERDHVWSVDVTSD